MQTWACWAGWEMRVFWNGAMYQKRCLWDTEKVTSKINEEVDSKVEDRFFKT